MRAVDLTLLVILKGIVAEMDDLNVYHRILAASVDAIGQQQLLSLPFHANTTLNMELEQDHLSVDLIRNGDVEHYIIPYDKIWKITRQGPPDFKTSDTLFYSKQAADRAFKRSSDK